MVLDLTMNTQEQSRVIRVPFREGTVLLGADQQVCVLWKKNVYYDGSSVILPRDIGDGMEMIVWKHTEPYDFPLDVTAFLWGLCVWQEYNEVSGQRETYLYKFPKDEERIASINSLLEAYGCVQRIVVVWRFVQVTDCPLFEVPPVADMTLESLLSLFFGLSLGYGQYERAASGSGIHRVFVTFPLVGVTAKYQEWLEQMRERFLEVLVLMQTDTLPGKMGFVWQASCKDWEILRLFAMWLMPAFPHLSTLPELQETIEHYLWVSYNDLPHDIQQYSVLKKLTK